VVKTGGGLVVEMMNAVALEQRLFITRADRMAARPASAARLPTAEREYQSELNEMNLVRAVGDTVERA
jgi:hypothetical protein